jgi:hypothetical protein
VFRQSGVLCRDVQVGDVSTMSLPYGDVVLFDHGRPMVSASAGIGITPMTGTLSHLAAAGSGLTMVLHLLGSAAAVAVVLLPGIHACFTASKPMRRATPAVPPRPGSVAPSVSSEPPASRAVLGDPCSRAVVRDCRGRSGDTARRRPGRGPGYPDAHAHTGRSGKSASTCARPRTGPADVCAAWKSAFWRGSRQSQEFCGGRRYFRKRGDPARRTAEAGYLCRE